MARDLFHATVREALEAEGWQVTHDPLILKAGGLRLEVDLAAEHMLVAERGAERIAVEVKSFIGKSKLNDFYEAKGQYDVYRRALKDEAVARKLYLAIDQDTHKNFFHKALIAELVSEDAISLLIFDLTTKRIVQWIPR